ncbi:MAG: DUF4214 domain-containing protein [Saccharofermentans sp.]|nr:DUF4214 domain-containing protein [Saccharofermentans sp.]
MCTEKIFKNIISTALAFIIVVGFIGNVSNPVNVVNEPVSPAGDSSVESVSVDATYSEQADVTPVSYGAEADGVLPAVSIEDEATVPDYSKLNLVYDNVDAEIQCRDDLELIENSIIFSVVDYRDISSGMTFLSDSDEICSRYGMTNVSYMFDVYAGATEIAGINAYQVFYSATVYSDDIWALIDELRQDAFIVSAEPDVIYEQLEDEEEFIPEETEDPESIEPELVEELVVEADSYSYSNAIMPTEEEIRNCAYVIEPLRLMDVWKAITVDHMPGEGVVVAVIDTGVNYKNSDLASSMWINPGEIPNNGIDDDKNGYVDDVHGICVASDNPSQAQGDPMDYASHGTHCAGIIAMSAGDGGGVGVAYGSKIMAIKVGEGTFSLSAICVGLRYAADNGADVISMSFSGEYGSASEEAACKYAANKCILVAAAGNDAKCTLGNPKLDRSNMANHYPAAFDSVIGVMAYDNDNTIASFSDWDYQLGDGHDYELIAPGVSIYSTVLSNYHARYTGTSMATPVVAGCAAIYRAEYPDRSNQYIRNHLCAPTDEVVNAVLFGSTYTFNKINIADKLLCYGVKFGPDHEPIVDPSVQHRLFTISAREATCTESGYTEGIVCLRCGMIIEATELIPAAHTVVTDYATEPTCIEVGFTEGSHCEVCNEVIVAQQEIPAKGHVECLEPEIPATCTSDGFTEGAYCTVCREVTKARELIPAKGHTVVTIPGVPATCTSWGLTESSYCTTCNESFSVKTPTAMKVHAFVPMPESDATIYKDGSKGGTYCVHCKTIGVQPVITPKVDVSPEIANFSERLYTVVLNRPADPAGVTAWAVALSNGADGASVAKGFYFSGEFDAQNTSNTEYVKRLYLTFMNREADAVGLNAWVEVLDNGTSRVDVFYGFVNSVEWANYCAKCGIVSGGTAKPVVRITPNKDITEFTKRLYVTCLGRPADSTGLEAWASALANKEGTGASVAYGFFFSDEFVGQNLSNEEYVTRLYRTFMGREPDASGFEAWVGALNDGFSREQVFDGFSKSVEFVASCEKAGIIAY